MDLESDSSEDARCFNRQKSGAKHVGDWWGPKLLQGKPRSATAPIFPDFPSSDISRVWLPFRVTEQFLGLQMGRGLHDRSSETLLCQTVWQYLPIDFFTDIVHCDLVNYLVSTALPTSGLQVVAATPLRCAQYQFIFQCSLYPCSEEKSISPRRGHIEAQNAGRTIHKR